MKKPQVATVSVFSDDGHREPWAFCWLDKPTLPAKNAVGVATESRIFKKVLPLIS